MTYFALENKIRQENEKSGTETLSSHICSQRYACDDAYLFFIGKLWQEDGWASERQPMASCQAWFSNVSLAKIALSKGAAAGNVSSSAAEASSCIIIPASLIQLGDDNSNFVWVDEGGKAVRRTIVCGEYMSNGVSIVSGLKHGDKLIVEGQQKVCTGTPLKAIVPKLPPHFP